MKTDTIIIIAQLLLTILFLAGYFCVVSLFMFGVVRVPTDYREVFISVVGVLTAPVVTIVAFWFNRPRHTGVST